MKNSFMIMVLSLGSLSQAADRINLMHQYNTYFIADNSSGALQILKENPDLLNGALLMTLVFKKKNNIAKEVLKLPGIDRKFGSGVFQETLDLAVKHNEELVERLLHKAAYIWASERLTDPEVEDFQGLFRQGACLLASDALHSAKNAKVVDMLIEYGADATSTDPNGFTALHHAVNKGLYDAARALIPYSDINATTYYGSTPLSFAQTEPMRKLLREAGAEQ